MKLSYVFFLDFSTVEPAKWNSKSMFFKAFLIWFKSVMSALMKLILLLLGGTISMF
jgi:hypothetical protein